MTASGILLLSGGVTNHSRAFRGALTPRSARSARTP
jgi:hypothetical protein